MSDNFIPLKDSSYGDGIVVDVYNGTISIVAAQTGKDDNAYMKWCHPQVGTFEERRPHDKAVPWKITLGENMQDAIDMLGALAGIIKGLGDDNPF